MGWRGEVLRLMEPIIRTYADDWLMFHPVWPARDRSRHADAIGPGVGGRRHRPRLAPAGMGDPGCACDAAHQPRGAARALSTQAWPSSGWRGTTPSSSPRSSWPGLPARLWRIGLGDGGTHRRVDHERIEGHRPAPTAVLPPILAWSCGSCTCRSTRASRAATPCALRFWPAWR